MNKAHRKIQNAGALLLIFSLIINIISPFCALHSSSTENIEICTPSGMQIIERTVNQTSPADPPSKQQQSNKKTCSYCFASHMERLPANASNIVDLPIGKIQSQILPKEYIIAYNQPATRYEARAPPYTT